LQALGLYSFGLDQYEVVHENVPQVFNPRCLLEIELRLTGVGNVERLQQKL
jgi:hypothetical protein